MTNKVKLLKKHAMLWVFATHPLLGTDASLDDWAEAYDERMEHPPFFSEPDEYYSMTDEVQYMFSDAQLALDWVFCCGQHAVDLILEG